MSQHWQDAKNTLLKTFIASTRIGIITDMDGTLAPIVPVPSDAAPTDRNRALLEKLHTQVALVAVVSGRAAADVRERVNLPHLVYSGNHGLERWENGEVVVAPAVEPYLDALQRAKTAIEARQPSGMWVEDKSATLSVHYRNTDDPQQTAQDYLPVMHSIAREHDLRVFQGRMIFELRPPLEMHKGTVFQQLIDEHNLESAIFLGDDTTDADALKMAQTLRESGRVYALGVGVQSADTPSVVIESADLLVEGVPGVEALLSWLSDTLDASTAS